MSPFENNLRQGQENIWLEENRIYMKQKKNTFLLCLESALKYFFYMYEL